MDAGLYRKKYEFQYNYLLLLNFFLFIVLLEFFIFQYNYLLLLNISPVLSAYLQMIPFQYNYLLLLNEESREISSLSRKISIQLLVTIKLNLVSVTSACVMHFNTTTCYY